MIDNKYIGHPSQLSGVEEYRLLGGKGDGMHFMRIRNGLGLEFSVCADRCADISALSLDGCNLSYTSPSGYVAPQYYNEGQTGFGFLNSFNCGFLTTCGLQNIGMPNEDEGTFHGLHGSISNIPADYIHYQANDTSIWIHATMRDQVIFGSKFTLDRTINCSLTDNVIVITDEVRNDGSNEEPVMLLYHMNLGYPLLDEHTTLEINSNNVIPRDERAAQGLDEWNTMLSPIPNFDEQCYYHKFSDTTATALIANKTIKKALKISFDTNNFPQLTEWKMMGEHDYVLGIEPCTNTLEGRHTIRQKNELQTLKPGESRKFSVTINLMRTK